jgi:hypothetical protein
MAMHASSIRFVCLALLALAACNKQASTLDTPVSPTPTVPFAPTPPPGSVSPVEVATVNLAHSAVAAGASVTGVVNILGPAPAAGATVSLSSSDVAASVPATVAIAAGETSGAFTVTILPVIEDRHLVITARTAGRSAIAALSIWSALPEFFHWFSERDDVVGEGGFSRYHPGHSEFSAVCDGNAVRIEMEAPGDDFWSLWFKAPPGEPLRTGTYEGVTQIGPANRPNATMFIKGGGRSCDEVNGRFVITELDLRDDRVNRFRASFEQQCATGDQRGWFRGEVRLANLPPSSSAAGCQR